MAVLGGGAVSYERGALVEAVFDERSTLAGGVRVRPPERPAEAQGRACEGEIERLCVCVCVCV